MNVGDRVTLEQVTCIRYSWYERTIHHEQTRVYHRYVFRDCHGDKYVYSGVSLGIREGCTYDIRATIKRDERDTYGVFRLSRVTVEYRGKRERLL